jgi:hypothetical protein
MLAAPNHRHDYLRGNDSAPGGTWAAFDLHTRPGLIIHVAD